MKKIYISGLIIGATLVVAPLLVFAQDDAAGDKNRPLIHPPALGLLIKDGVKENENARNIALQVRSEQGSTTASSSQETRRELGLPVPKKFDDRMRSASSTFASSTRGPGLGLHNENMEKRNDLRLEMFKKQQDHIVSQLQRALDNLKNIRERISSRITKAESSGRDMTKAKALLVTADAKISAAQVAIDTVSSFTPTASSTASSTASTTPVSVDLERPRKVAGDAIKAVKDAQKSLVDVVIAIAHDMGIRLDDHATSTPPITATTTATSTASTTI